MAAFTAKVMRRKGANYELSGAELAADLHGLKIRAGVLSDPQMAERAAFNEFGTDKIPSRPFISSAFKENQKGYKIMAARIIKARMNKKAWVQDAEALGYQMQRDIQAKIKDGMSPENARSTVLKKGHGHTLFETGKMHDSITYEVDKRK